MMRNERTIQTLAMLLICLATSFAMTPASFSASDDDTTPLVTVTQIPDFVLFPDDALPDPTFRSDVAILAPYYGTPSHSQSFSIPSPNSKSFKDFNILHQTPSINETLLKWYFPKIEGLTNFADFRAIVQAPLFCTIIEQQSCDPDMEPNGVLQFTSMDRKAGTTGVIRFPLTPVYTIHFHTEGSRMHKLQLWISNSQTKIIRTIKLFDDGSGTPTAMMPILDGVSTAGLPKVNFKKIEKFDKATSVKIMNSDGTLLTEMLLDLKRQTGASGYAKISPSLCGDPLKLDMCGRETQIAYTWHEIEYPSDKVSLGIRFQITIRQPNSTQEITFIGSEHGMDPENARFDEILQLEGFAYVTDRLAPGGIIDRSLYNLSFVFGKKIEGLSNNSKVLGHTFDLATKND